jgi:diaminohydroxyphosphoribosylaminopyrimidine deaminase/5-amino-6-(5-phosphoribosylamino)uracil reductase
VHDAKGFSATDSRLMSRALRLAHRGLHSTHPNPRVGCVLAKDGHVVAEGWHERAGEPHAEINALRAAGPEATGATAYVTLEPCSHHGKTPPCANALIEAGVSRVVIAMSDPNPAVAGQGIARLEAAGISVQVGLLESEAGELNRGFVARVTRGRPFVTLKVAASLDGATAMASGESQWITGADARRDVQRLRALSGAILTGAGTVIADDPALTVRDGSTGERQPLRAIMDSRLRTPPTAKLLREPGTTLIFCVDDDSRVTLEEAGAIVTKLPPVDDRVDPGAVLEQLAGRGVNDVLVECGPLLAGALLSGQHVDELVIYQAPHIMGSNTHRIAETPGWRGLSDRLALSISDVRRIGNDLRITARPAD